jgi:cytochrome P450
MGLLDKVSESNIFGWAYDMIRETHQFGSAPFLTRMAQRFSRLLGAMDVSTKYENNIVDQSIDRYLESQKDLEQKGGSRPQRNLASRILQVQASGKGETKLTDVEVRLLLQLILIAGTTDAVTWLNSIFYHLMRHPSKMDKLVRELKQRRADGLLSDPCTAQQTAECSYLNAVLNESIRLFPSVAGILPREVPKGGIEIAGRHVPAGVCNPSRSIPWH